MSPDATGPDAVGPDAVGPDAVGPDAAGAWSGLVAAALLGTDRAGDGSPDLPAPVRAAAADAGVDLEAGGPAALLDAAALLDVARAAGSRPLRLGPDAALVLVEPAPPETRPTARTTVPTVARLLAGPREDLDEWLDLVRTRQLLVPAHALPALMARAVTDTGLRDGLRDVVGHRGPWAAALDPALAPLVEAWGGVAAVPDVADGTDGAAGTDGTDDGEGTDDETWRLGSLPARRAWLVAARRRDPAAARDLLAAALPGLPAAERAELVTVLGTGLSAADEDLLERLLDDRAASVRSRAAGLLARLPTSAFTGRARARAAALLRVARVGLRRHVVVALPEEPFEVAARRDGLTEPTQDAGAWPGRRAQRLHQVLAAAPLDTWVPALAPTPAELVRLPVADDRGDLVHDAWVRVVQREPDPVWAGALLGVAPAHAAVLVPLLAGPQRLRAVTGLLRGRGPERAVALQVLGTWPRPWPVELVDAVVAAVRRTPADTGYGDRANARELATLLGRRADPLTTTVDPGEDAHLARAAELLADRRQTIEETTA